MRQKLIFLAVFWILLALCAAIAADVIDRIVATVNGHIILQSDWDSEVAFESFMDARDVDRIGDEQRKAALDHLIDQALLRQQMQSPEFRHVSEQDLSSRVTEIRKQYTGAASDDHIWRGVLARYGLTETDLKDHIALQFDVMRLVDSRFRSSIQIDSKTVESYYNQQLLPQVRQKGAKAVPLSEVAPKIKELLTQEKMNQMLTAWLQNLRSSGEIKTGTTASFAGGPAE